MPRRSIVLLALLPLDGAFAQGIRYDVTEIPGYNGQLFHALDISETGIVLGKAVIPGQGFQVLLWTPGGFASIGRPAETSDMDASRINKHGAIAGTATIQGRNRAFRYIPFNGFEVIGDVSSGYAGVGKGINSAGVVVGHSPGFVSPGGTNWFPVAPLAGDIYTIPNDVNDSYVVVGASYQTSSANAARACRWIAGSPLLLGQSPNYPASTATSVNAHGQIVGSSFRYNGLYTEQEAYYWSPEGGMEHLGAAGLLGQTQANDINFYGSIVGDAYNWPGPRRAWIKHRGWPKTLLNDLLVPASAGWDIVSANAINDGGVIVGLGIRDGSYRAYMAMPVYGGNPRYGGSGLRIDR